MPSAIVTPDHEQHTADLRQERDQEQPDHDEVVARGFE